MSTPVSVSVFLKNIGIWPTGQHHSYSKEYYQMRKRVLLTNVPQTGNRRAIRRAMISSNVAESNVSNLSNALSSLSSKNSCDLLGFEMHKRRMQPPHYSQSYSFSIPMYLDSPEHVLGLQMCVY